MLTTKTQSTWLKHSGTSYFHYPVCQNIWDNIALSLLLSCTAAYVSLTSLTTLPLVEVSFQWRNSSNELPSTSEDIQGRKRNCFEDLQSQDGIIAIVLTLCTVKPLPDPEIQWILLPLVSVTCWILNQPSSVLLLAHAIVFLLDQVTSLSELADQVKMYRHGEYMGISTWQVHTDMLDLQQSLVFHPDSVWCLCSYLSIFWLLKKAYMTARLGAVVSDPLSVWAALTINVFHMVESTAKICPSFSLPTSRPDWAIHVTERGKPHDG